MRRVAVVSGVGLAFGLACGGTENVEVPRPIEPEPVAAPVVPEAPAPAPELPEGAFTMVTFTDDGPDCAIALVAVGTDASRPVGKVAGACPESTWDFATVSIPEGGGHILVATPGGAIEGDPGAMKTLPPLPEGWSTDRIAYDANKPRVVALGTFQGEAAYGEADDDGYTEVTWTVDGAPFTFRAEPYAAGIELCGAFEWTGAGWSRLSLDGNALPEGTSPPWCATPLFDLALVDPIDRPSSGGHGTFLEARTDARFPEGEWARFTVSFSGRPSEWLEGQSQLTPLWFTPEEGAWGPVPGFDEGTEEVAIHEADRYAIVCTRAKSAVVDTLARGDVVWKGTRCPFIWPAE